MTVLLKSSVYTSGCKGYRTLLALSFLCGLFFGMVTYISAEDALYPLMRSCFYVPLSISTLGMITCIPFLFSVVITYICYPGWIAALCFFKAFSFGFTTLGIYSCFGNASYFALALLCFTDLVSLPVLYFWWQRSFLDMDKFSISATALFLSVAILIGSLYIRFICPIWG